MAIIAGTKFLLVFTVLAGGVILYMFYTGRRQQRTPSIRHINGLDAIEEAVGRATEMGTPVHFAPGISGVTDQTAPQTLAGLELLSYTADLVAKYNAELMVSICVPTLLPIAQEVVRQRFIAAGRPEMFQESTVQYFSSDSFAYAAACMGYFTRKQVAANIMMGAFYAESLLMAESATKVGAIQIAGTANLAQMPFFVAVCDYTLIGEELYASSAYLSQDKQKLATIAGQDYVKLACMALLALGVLLQTLGSDYFVRLLKM